MKFCRNNEARCGNILLKIICFSALISSLYANLTGEAPFTGYFSKESPGRAAVWIGFRIVESYMMKNPSVKMEEMIKNTDVQEILGNAKYSPQ